MKIGRGGIAAEAAESASGLGTLKIGKRRLNPEGRIKRRYWALSGVRAGKANPRSEVEETGRGRKLQKDKVPWVGADVAGRVKNDELGASVGPEKGQPFRAGTKKQRSADGSERVGPRKGAALALSGERAPESLAVSNLGDAGAGPTEPAKRVSHGEAVIRLRAQDGELTCVDGSGLNVEQEPTAQDGLSEEQPQAGRSAEEEGFVSQQIVALIR